MPIAELAQLAKVSEGTVISFCNTLGFKGYQALKLALAVDLAEPQRVLVGDLTPSNSDDVETLAAKVFHADLQALEDTLKLLDPEAVGAAIDALAGAKRVALFAVGTSLPVAVDAASRFMRIGVPLHFEQDAHHQAILASLLMAGDVALAISHSGRSREPTECLQLARDAGATTIALTGRHPSPLTD
jgi:DNA-binding MurR/RpiR family transcriptional regulator